MPFVRPKPGDPAPSCVAGAPNNRRLAIPASDEKLFHADLPAYLTKNRAEYAEYFAYAARSASGLVVG